MQLGIGSVLGFTGGKLMIYLINRLNFFYEGIYPVFALALSVLIYSFSAFLEGSGFLAVYIAGIILGNGQFIHKKSLLRFFDSLAVLSQIAMFVTLGLLVFPSDLVPIIGTGLLLSAILMLIARPLSVFLTLIPFKFNLREKSFISWVGLRGAVPIILASFPLAAGVVNSRLIFNVVFFIVLTSTLLQGWSINFVSKLLKLARPAAKKIIVPIEFTSDNDSDTELVEIFIPHNSSVRGKQIVDLNFPEDTRIVLVVRDDKNIVPAGNTILEEGDLLLLLANKKNKETVNEIFNR
jgi:cell volume regulation protein A